MKPETGFICLHCQAEVPVTSAMGTQHRNHCPFCLWSKHVDRIPGDRAANCKAAMQPLGVTLKKEGTDKYTAEIKYGDIMLVHECSGCGAYSTNRIAADDTDTEIMNIFHQSFALSQSIKETLSQKNIVLLQPEDEAKIKTRLYGSFPH